LGEGGELLVAAGGLAAARLADALDAGHQGVAGPLG
jgi:hypothetical protein